jgi:hypothetical protein
MGLYLCVFVDDATDEEVDGVEVGSYEDFGRLRATVAERLEPDGWGTSFPVLMSHPDSCRTRSPSEATRPVLRYLQRLRMPVLRTSFPVDRFRS